VTPEEKLRAIKISKQIIANQLELLQINSYCENAREFEKQFKSRLRQSPAPTPAEDLQEQEKLNAVLAAAKAARTQQ
jgi:hypothetical protein